MTNDILLIETEERIQTLTLNRPQSRNALSSALRDRFFAALADVGSFGAAAAEGGHRDGQADEPDR